eukprot:gnl/TRDRNA2_/TRDRNA2_174930_c1_seq2.p1 gnl/TRDRNA2_/TRDRNA2_174930_c1~~gnl/TRDRNA2_/TRDRNA2_174930_c1_seq2.p1  ORF type:complete len:994 (+),score=202.34 gnl/TRDRNA2_/TRDRNA2_174930_c1_seq2:90-3071(+)
MPKRSSLIESVSPSPSFAAVLQDVQSQLKLLVKAHEAEVLLAGKAPPSADAQPSKYRGRRATEPPSLKRESVLNAVLNAAPVVDTNAGEPGPSTTLEAPTGAESKHGSAPSSVGRPPQEEQLEGGSRRGSAPPSTARTAGDDVALQESKWSARRRAASVGPEGRSAQKHQWHQMYNRALGGGLKMSMTGEGFMKSGAAVVAAPTTPRQDSGTLSSSDDSDKDGEAALRRASRASKEAEAVVMTGCESREVGALFEPDGEPEDREPNPVTKELTVLMQALHEQLKHLPSSLRGHHDECEDRTHHAHAEPKEADELEKARVSQAPAASADACPTTPDVAIEGMWSPSQTPRQDSQWAPNEEATRQMEISGVPLITAPEKVVWEVRPIWKEKVSIPAHHAGRASKKSEASVANFGADANLRDDGLLNWLSENFVIPPTNKFRSYWDAAAIFLMAYDFVVIPLSFLEMKPNPFLVFMGFCTLTYWAIDIPMTFFTALEAGGHLDTRISAIAKRYVRGWFSFDLFIVVLDLGLTIQAHTSGNMEGADMGKSARYLRLLRMMRLMRLLKMGGKFKQMMNRIKSEATLIILDIVKITVMITCLNHIIACFWFGMGRFSSEFYGVDNWVTDFGLEEEVLTYRYMTSLHWSLTQFTPASMEVTPKNAMERFFNILTLLFAFVCFAGFVSTVTDGVARMRALYSNQKTQRAALRSYMGQNHVPQQLVSRIWGFLDSLASKKYGKRIHKKSIALIETLPQALQNELSEQVYGPLLTRHPFFEQMNAVHQSAMIRLYAHVLEEMACGLGQELFVGGEKGEHMFFLVSGMLTYMWREDLADEYEPCELRSDTWFCEVVLWVDWKHTGQAVASVPCFLVAVNSVHFQELLVHELVGIVEPRKYAVMFVRYFNDLSDGDLPLSDIWMEIDDIEDLAYAAFHGADTEDDEDEEGGTPPMRRRSSRSAKEKDKKKKNSKDSGSKKKGWGFKGREKKDSSPNSIRGSSNSA